MDFREALMAATKTDTKVFRSVGFDTSGKLSNKTVATANTYDDNISPKLFYRLKFCMMTLVKCESRLLPEVIRLLVAKIRRASTRIFLKPT